MNDLDDAVKAKLEELFDCEWDDVLVVIETAATKSGRTHAEVIAGLLERTEHKPTPGTKIKRGLIRWIGKPWRERENPWDRFKDRVPPPPPRTDTPAEDLEEWTPLKPDEDE
ncbi:MAG: hypothetical protein WD646_13530 [Actinomycetota bacterium]